MKLFTKVIFIVVSFVLLFSFSENAKVLGQDKKGEIEDGIREIVFLKIIKPWKNSTNQELEFYFISVGNIQKQKNPNSKLLESLQKQYPQIREIKDSIMVEEKPIDEKTGKKGVIFYVDNIKWESKTKVIVKAGSYLGNMAADECIYTLKFEDAEWRITNSERCWIS